MDGQTIHLVGRLRRSDNAKGYLAGETLTFKVDGSGSDLGVRQDSSPTATGLGWIIIWLREP